LLVFSFLSIVLYLLAVRSRAAIGTGTLSLVSATILILIAAMNANMQGAMIIMTVLIGSFALAGLLAERSNENRSITLALKTSPKYALALAFVFMMVSAGVVYMFAFVARAYMADLYAGKSVRQNQVTEQTSIPLLARAVGFFPYEGRYYTRLGQEYMILANAEFLKKPEERDTNKLSNNIVQAVMYAREGQTRMTADAQANEVLAQVYENSLFYDAEFLTLARDGYQKALDLEPHNPLYLVKLGQIKATEASTKKDDEQKQLLEQSKQYFRDAITQKADYAPAHYQLGLALEGAANTGDAIIEIARALQADQTNETYMAAFARLAMARNDQDQMKAAAAILENDLKTNERSDALRLQYALILEKLKRPDDAIAQYKKLLSYVSSDDTQTKTQLQTMISNAQSGIDNVEYLKKQQQSSLAQQQGAAAAQQPAAPVQQPVAPQPAADVNAAPTVGQPQQ
jgi:tetratricopeptide (TPR) repeat protein